MIGFGDSETKTPVSSHEMMDFRKYCKENGVGYNGLPKWFSALSIMTICFCFIAAAFCVFVEGYDCLFEIPVNGFESMLEQPNFWFCFVGVILAFLFHLLSSNCKHVVAIGTDEDNDCCHIIMDKDGKFGLCSTGFVVKNRVKILKRMEYDDIVKISDCSYILKKDGLFGVYNTGVKKMMLPLKYDKIELLHGGKLLSAWNGDVEQTFELDGYRHF